MRSIPIAVFRQFFTKPIQDALSKFECITFRLHQTNASAPNSGHAQFGHFGKLKHFLTLVHRGKLKDFGHQTRTAPARETLYASNGLRLILRRLFRLHGQFVLTFIG